MADSKVDLQIWWDEMGPPVAMTFPLANTPYAAEHKLGVIPDGFLVEDAEGPVYRTAGRRVTRELMYLESSRAATRAVVRFFTRREGPL